jgi:transcriptional regulator with XRE-family HTH domain
MVEEAEFRRKAARQLAAQREKRGLSQTVVAAMMGTSASVVSKLESGADVKISTLVRYCQAVGERWSFVPVVHRGKAHAAKRTSTGTEIR